MKKVGRVLGYLAPKLKLVDQSLSGSTKYNLDKYQKENPNFYNGKHVPGSVRVALKAMEEVEKLYG